MSATSLYHRSVGSPEPKQVVTQHLWGARPGHRDELILRDRDSDGDGSLDERLYCLMDYFNPVAVVDIEGEVKERYAWSAFGLRSVMAPGWSPRAESHFAWNFAFHGQFLDNETGYYDYGYRYYSPWLGRWISRDPIGEKGGVNLYHYCNNSAPNLNDYLGTKTVSVLYLLDEAVTNGDFSKFTSALQEAFADCKKLAEKDKKKLAADPESCVCGGNLEPEDYEVTIAESTAIQTYPENLMPGQIIDVSKSSFFTETINTNAQNLHNANPATINIFITGADLRYNVNGTLRPIGGYTLTSAGTIVVEEGGPGRYVPHELGHFVGYSCSSAIKFQNDPNRPPSCVHPRDGVGDDTHNPRAGTMMHYTGGNKVDCEYCMKIKNISF